MIRLLAWAYLLILVAFPAASLFRDALSEGPGKAWLAITDPVALAAVGLTVALAALATLVNLVAGVIVALALSRGRVPFRPLLEAVVDVPLAIPAVVAGLALLSLYGPQSPVGLKLVTTPWAILAALLFVTLPLSVRTIQTGLDRDISNVEGAAATLGATGAQTFRRVTLPALRPAIVSAGVLCFARCLGEFGAVVLVAGNVPFKSQVASFHIYGRSESGDRVAASAVAALLLIASIAALLLLDRRSRER